MEEGEQLRLTPEGAMDVARWAAAAIESGHFDWNLLCGDHGEENIAERWRLVRWLNDMKLLDGPLADTKCQSADDKEGAAACMLAFLFSNVREVAGREGCTPEEVVSA